MSPQYDPLSEEEIETYFTHEEVPPPGTYDLALALGGTVSAGAYTAGVLDFLIEALDCWEQAKEDKTVPQHKVRLRVLTGTSGGGVNAAIAARALRYAYPYGAVDQNPFYRLWTKGLTLSKFLETSDLERSDQVISLLNGMAIDDTAEKAVSFSTSDIKQRNWVNDPLKVILTVTNLRGVPYKVDLGNNQFQTYVNHADHLRFAVNYAGAAYSPRPDEFLLGFPGAAGEWRRLSLAGCATGAFPVGFPPRELERPMSHYRYRVTVVPGAQGNPAETVPMRPDWAALTPKGQTALPVYYNFLCVDGGATNNEPVELARTTLSGVVARAPRAADKADRGLILIDPFAGTAELGPAKWESLPAAFAAFVYGAVGQARFDTQDILLAADDKVFSRFMIAAKRDGAGNGGPSLASSGLFAFIGFASEAFSRHDFLLGRRNCQKFLRDGFKLAASNPIFIKATPPHPNPKNDPMLPIIPLYGSANAPIASPAWPQGKLDPEDYRDAIADRVEALIRKAANGAMNPAFAWLFAEYADGRLADFAIDQMKKALSKSDLL